MRVLRRSCITIYYNIHMGASGVFGHCFIESNERVDTFQIHTLDLVETYNIVVPQLVPHKIF